MTLGGKKLRELRLERSETIEHIAIDAGITYKALSEIERGITKRPSWENLYSILEALEEYGEIGGEDWQIVFESYGYRKPYPLPSEGEIKQARQQWREDYGHIIYPAYLVDFSQRVLDWNRYAPKLLGMSRADLRTNLFQNVTVFDLAFGFSRRFIHVVNEEEYLYSFVYTTKNMMESYRDEPWYAKCMRVAWEQYPVFKKLWDSIPEDGPQPSLTGLAVPIVLDLPGESSHLTFQLVKVDFVADERFWIVQWIPVDEITMRRCLEWVQEEARQG